MNRKTLAYRLVFAVTALVTAITLSVVVASTLATYQIMMRQADARLASLGDPPPNRPGRGGPARNVERFGMAVGTIVIDMDANPKTGAILTPQGAASVTPGVLEKLVSSVGRRPTSLMLPEGGWYRARTVTKAGTNQLVAIPLHDLTSTMTWLLPFETLLAAGVIAASYFATRRIVRIKLQPLNRLAGTAHRVSDLDLSTGDVKLSIRVAPQDCDPDTEVGKVGQAFNHMLDNVEGALAARQQSETQIRQFVADASHELRNPLAAIRGYAELSRRNLTELPENTQNAIVRIDAESARMSALVEDMLLLARLDSRPSLQVEPISVSNVLAGAVSDAQVAGPAHLWFLSLPETEVVAVADENRLTQVVTNLLANARTHTPAGTEVVTSLSQVDGFAVIQVTDNGPGIPVAEQSSVFERFTRGESHRARHEGAQSTGLGLAIVSALVSAMRGSVALTSVPGKTTFTIRLPLA